MGRVYSERFIAVQDSTDAVVYTVVSGFKAVIRDVDLYWGATVGVSTFYLKGSAGNVIAVFASTPTEETALTWRGRQVINEGESFELTGYLADGAAYDAAISGYLLSLP
jgi:hypothetical protein